MKDGTTTSGNVVSNSDKEITVVGDDKITRTIPMDQVRSVEYSDTAPVPATATDAAAPPPTESTLPEQNVTAPAMGRQASVAPVRKTHLGTTAAQSQAVERSKLTYELTIGTRVSVRTFDTIDSATAAEGQIFSGEVSNDVVDAAGEIVIPARSNAEIVIQSASKGGRFRGTSDLVLDLKSVTIGGKRYAIKTAAITEVGKQGIGANKRTATFTGGGAALGAIIGAIAGGGKGAAIGAASGAGAGVVTQAVTKGSSIKVSAETILTFQLDKPLIVSTER